MEGFSVPGAPNTGPVGLEGLEDWAADDGAEEEVDDCTEDVEDEELDEDEEDEEDEKDEDDELRFAGGSSSTLSSPTLEPP